MDHAATADRERALTELAPGIAGKPWPRIVVVLLSITGLITPFLCLAIAPLACGDWRHSSSVGVEPVRLALIGQGIRSMFNDRRMFWITNTNQQARL